MEVKPYPQAKILIVYLMAEIRRPVSCELFAKLENEDVLSMPEVMQE
jgi:hypothetical protein